jgi:hypothetical protein
MRTNTARGFSLNKKMSLDSASERRKLGEDNTTKRGFSTHTKFFLRNYEDQKIKFLQMMNDPKNPYSIFWPNKILEKRFNLEIGVNGYINGVPVIKLVKKKEGDLPSVI